MGGGLIEIGGDSATEVALRAVLAGLGGHERPLDPGPNPRALVEKYGLRLDKTPFDFGPLGYMHLVPIYESIALSGVVMAGAQTGKTGMILSRVVWALLYYYGAMFGFYFPDDNLPKAFSVSRFAPFVRGNQVLREWVGRDTIDGKGQDATRSRTLGSSRIFFLTTGGKTSTESMPFKGIFFDEVRRMAEGDVQRAEERTSAQLNPLDWKVSTAGHPNQDIDAYFKRGKQSYFHTECRCPDGVILSTHGPECILDLRKATPAMRRKVDHAFAHAGIPNLGFRNRQEGEVLAGFHACYYCPVCGTILPNPREGWWAPESPDAYTESWQLGQHLSPSVPAARLLQKIDRPNEPVDMQEVWNSGFGLPYIDQDRMPVQIDHLMQCADDSIEWAAHLPYRQRMKVYPNTAMGVDVQNGYNVVVVKALVGRKYRTIHLEIAAGDDPWIRTAQIMHEYDVASAVVDAQPAWNEALRFAKAFRPRVYLAYFNDNEHTEMVKWRDTGAQPSQRGETRFPYTVQIQKLKAYKWSAGRWTRRMNDLPNPRRLIQKLPLHNGRALLTPNLRAGSMGPVPLCRDLYFHHWTRIAFENKYEGDKEKAREGKRKEVVIGVGLDPHFADADVYANVALSRLAPVQ